MDWNFEEMETYKHKIDFLLESPSKEEYCVPLSHSSSSAVSKGDTLSGVDHASVKHVKSDTSTPSMASLLRQHALQAPAHVIDLSESDIPSQYPRASISAPTRGDPSSFPGDADPAVAYRNLLAEQRGALGSTDRRMMGKKMQLHGQPYNRTEDFVNWWLSALRAQTYCSILSKPEGADSKFKCTFSSTCDKIIKGKGNLRRHIEWHLRRVEEETRSNFSRMADPPAAPQAEEAPTMQYKMTKDQQRQFVEQKLQQKNLMWKPSAQQLHLQHLLARDNSDVNFSRIGMSSQNGNVFGGQIE